MVLSLKDKAYEIADELVAIRRDLHMHPELSFEEFETSRKITEKLEELGIEVTKGVGKTGVVGLLKENNDGKVVGLRGDIDALPIEEQNEVEYKSQNSGVMHACGHDVHTTSLLGAAILLSSVRDKLPGSVKFLFQPAEEKNKGAKMMMEEKVLKSPDVDAIYGLHNSPNIPAGQVGVKEGALMAAVDTIKIRIEGENAHGATPHKARDAIIAAAALIQNLQTIVSRNISPFETAVVSIGTIEGGQANNVISDYVELTGTVRTFNPIIREEIPKIMERIIKDTCRALNTEGELEYIFDLPAVINEEETTEIGREAVEEIVGEEGIITPKLTGGGEDFAIFQQEIPGCFYFLGVRNEAKGIVHEWHHPKFDIDEKALPIGAGILAQSALNYLVKNK